MRRFTEIMVEDTPLAVVHFRDEVIEGAASLKACKPQWGRGFGGDCLRTRSCPRILILHLEFLRERSLIDDDDADRLKKIVEAREVAREDINKVKLLVSFEVDRCLREGMPTYIIDMWGNHKMKEEGTRIHDQLRSDLGI